MAYLAVEATREGHATYAHVHEIVAGLRRLGMAVDLFASANASGPRVIRPIARVLAQLLVQLRLLLRWHQYDVVYVRAHYTAFPAAVFARLTGRRIVQEVNGPVEDVFIAHPWTRQLRPLLSWIHLWQLTHADALITVTPALGSWLRTYSGRQDVEVIPNGANTELFSPRRTATRPLPRPYVVFFGALTTWQGIDTLLTAFEHPGWPEDVHLVILGDGALHRMVAAADARHAHVHWLRRVPYADVGGIVAGALAGVVPKNSQGNRQETGLLPLKLFEIAASGIPVIATEFPGQADFVREHGCGLVIPPESPEALAGAVRQLTDDPAAAHAMGLRGRSAVTSAHSWSHRASDTARVLRRAVCKDAASAAPVSG